MNKQKKHLAKIFRREILNIWGSRHENGLSWSRMMVADRVARIRNLES